MTIGCLRRCKITQIDLKKAINRVRLGQMQKLDKNQSSYESFRVQVSNLATQKGVGAFYDESIPFQFEMAPHLQSDWLK